MAECTAWDRRDNLYSDNILDTFDGLDLFDQDRQLSVVGYTDHKIPLKDAVVRIDGYVAQHGVGLLGND